MRRDLTCERGVHTLKSRDKIAQEAGESCGLTVTRYIALTKLIPPLLALVDEDKLFVQYRRRLHFCPNKTGTIDKLGVVPVKGQLAKIKKYSKEGNLTAAVIDAVLSEERAAPIQVTLNKDRLKQYFPQSYTAQQMEEVILSLLDNWRTQNAQS